mmetsp:Transcript_71056/g.141178  ORF Transcript_71056/g.141178 Transcript_71056/m.141178 type:complete len:186 (+) Transcript_71056:146-703(+)
MRAFSPGQNRNGPRFSIQRNGHRAWVHVSRKRFIRTCKRRLLQQLASLPKPVSKRAFHGTVQGFSVGRARADRTSTEKQRHRDWRRWEMALHARRLLAQPRTTSACQRCFVVCVRLHRGVDVNIENGICDMARCHTITRNSALPGDFVLGISASPGNSPAKDPHDDQKVWPPAYWAALRQSFLIK